MSTIFDKVEGKNTIFGYIYDHRLSMDSLCYNEYKGLLIDHYRVGGEVDDYSH